MNPDLERALRGVAGTFGDLFNSTVPNTLDRLQYVADPLLALAAPVIHWATTTTPILRDKLHGGNVRFGEPITRGNILKYLGISYYALQALTILNWSVEKIMDIGGKIIENGPSVEDVSIMVPLSIAVLTLGSGAYELIYRPIHWAQNTRRENQKANIHAQAQISRTMSALETFETPPQRAARRKREDEAISKKAHRNVLLTEVEELYPDYYDMMRAYESGDTHWYNEAYEKYLDERSAVPSSVLAEVDDIITKRYEFDETQRRERRKRMNPSFGARLWLIVKREELPDEKFEMMPWDDFFSMIGK